MRYMETLRGKAGSDYSRQFPPGAGRARGYGPWRNRRENSGSKVRMAASRGFVLLSVPGRWQDSAVEDSARHIQGTSRFPRAVQSPNHGNPSALTSGGHG